MKEIFTYKENEDYTLFYLLQKKDKDAFSIIYQKYHAYLYALALRYLKNTEMAEDAIQQVFMKLWENSCKIDVQINLKNYLYTMTKNYILNQIRNHKETISIYYANSQKELVDEDIFLKNIEDLQIDNLLNDAINKLPKQKKEICQMKIENGASNQQIADKMGIKINTVKSHYQESVKMLREHLKNIRILFL